jgi:hypothetical protein
MGVVHLSGESPAKSVEETEPDPDPDAADAASAPEEPTPSLEEVEV